MNNDNTPFEDVDDPSDELGYTEYDWANLSEEETESHDRIIQMDEDEVLALDFSALTDLEKWAAAQVLSDFDNPKDNDLIDELIRGSKDHPAIDYLGIAMERAYDYIMEESEDDAREIIQIVRELATEDEADMPEALEAMLLYWNDHETRAMAKYQEVLDTYRSSPEVLINIAGHFSMFGLRDRAHELLDQADVLARTENDQEMVDLIADFRANVDAEDEDEDF